MSINDAAGAIAIVTFLVTYARRPSRWLWRGFTAEVAKAVAPIASKTESNGGDTNSVGDIAHRTEVASGQILAGLDALSADVGGLKSDMVATRATLGTIASETRTNTEALQRHIGWHEAREAAGR